MMAASVPHSASCSLGTVAAGDQSSIGCRSERPYNRIMRSALVVVAFAITCSARTTFADDTIQITTDARAIRQGDVVVFTAITSQPVDAMHARAFDRDLATFRLDVNRWQALLGVDIVTDPGPYKV